MDEKSNVSAELESRRVLTPDVPVLNPGDAFYELSQQFKDMISRRAYELFELRGSLDGYDREDWLQAQSEILRDVPVEVVETETGVTVTAEVPGFSEKNLEVRVAPRSLCVMGSRQETSEQSEGGAIYSERRTSQIFRAVELPCEVDPERVDATVSNGLLEINLLKVAQGKKVPVQGKAATA